MNPELSKYGINSNFNGIQGFGINNSSINDFLSGFENFLKDNNFQNGGMGDNGFYFKPNEEIDLKECYAFLGLKETASVEDIKKAYKKLAKLYHPDRVKNVNKTEANAKFDKLNKAYSKIKKNRNIK